MKKLIFLFFTLFLGSYSFSQSKEKIDELINHSNSFYWLSRSRQNTVYDAKISDAYLDSAMRLIQRSQLSDSIKNSYYASIKSRKNEIKGLKEVSYDNLNGNHPIYMQFTGQLEDQYEYRDDALETVVENALADILNANTIKPSKPLNELLAFCVVGIEPKNEMLKEVIKQYLNNNSKLYVVSDFELMAISGRENPDINNDLLKLIGENFSSNLVGKISVSVYDSLEDVNYCGVRFELLDLESNEIISTTYTEELRVSKVETYDKFFSNALPRFVLVFLIFLLPLSFFLLYRSRKKVHVNFKYISIRFLAIIFGLVLGLISSFGVVIAFSLFAPDGGAFINDPMSKIWPLAFIITISLLLPAILIILHTLIMKRTFVGQKDTLFLFISSLYFGIVIVLHLHYFIYFEESWPIYYSWILIGTLSIVTLFVASWYVDFYAKNLKLFWIILPIVLSIPISISLGYYFYISPDFNDFNSMIIVTAIGFIPIALYTLYNVPSVKIKLLHLLNADKDEETIQTGILERFQKFISNQLSDYQDKPIVSFTDGYVSKLEELVLNSVKHLNLIHLEGESGIGKTSLINSLSASLEQQKNVYFYYSDCDQFTEGTQVPYEPFYQAFEEHFGIGSFYAGNTGAIDILKKANPVLAGISGVGSIVESITRNADDAFKGAKVSEVFSVIKSHFLDISARHSGEDIRIVFVLEDVQWIDTQTSELFAKFLNEMALMSQRNSNFYVTIISTRAINKAENDINEREKLFLDLLNEKSKRNQDLINFVTWNDNVVNESLPRLSELPSNNFLLEVLSKDKSGFNFSPDSVKKLANYFEQNEVKNPRYILEIIGFLQQKEWFIEKGGYLSLSEEINWESIPLSADVEAVYIDLFKSMDKQLLKFIGSAAFIGLQFEAAVLSKLWNIERLELIHLLLEAEKQGLIIDINDQDDIYAFTTKKVRNALKRFVLRDSKQSNLPQIVKEYHKEIINIGLEGKKITFETFSFLYELDLNKLAKLAERAIYVVNEMGDEGKILMAVSGVRSFENGSMAEAAKYLNYINYSESNLYGEIPKALQCKIKLDLRTYYNDKKKNQELSSTLDAILRILNLNDNSHTSHLDDQLESISLLLDINLQVKQLTEEDFNFLIKKWPSSATLIKLHKTLLNKDSIAGKFTDEQIKDLQELKRKFAEKPLWHSRSHGRYLNVLGSISSDNEAVECVIARLEIILIEEINHDSLEKLIDYLKLLNIKRLNFDQLEDLAYLTGSISALAQRMDLPIDKKLTANIVRFDINERLGDRFGTYLSLYAIAELCSEKVEISNLDEDFKNANQAYFDLFYKFPESNYRVFIYPAWLKLLGHSSNENALLDEKIITATLMVKHSIENGEFNVEAGEPKLYVNYSLINEVINTLPDSEFKETLFNLQKAIN